MERLNAGATITYGVTVSYGGAELFTVVAYCCTVGKFYYRGHRNLRCHRKLRWRSFSNFCFWNQWFPGLVWTRFKARKTKAFRVYEM
ncbi:hypothetical protein HanHA300_Chr09g0310421 [Helianthus annuus]|nr:hypothetical protein HanHA300_Chr09g0310421 [Helianthus annuus]